MCREEIAFPNHFISSTPPGLRLANRLELDHQPFLPKDCPGSALRILFSKQCRLGQELKDPILAVRCQRLIDIAWQAREPL